MNSVQHTDGLGVLCVITGGRDSLVSADQRERDGRDRDRGEGCQAAGTAITEGWLPVTAEDGEAPPDTVHAHRPLPGAVRVRLSLEKDLVRFLCEQGRVSLISLDDPPIPPAVQAREGTAWGWPGHGPEEWALSLRELTPQPRTPEAAGLGVGLRGPGESGRPL